MVKTMRVEETFFEHAEALQLQLADANGNALPQGLSARARIARVFLSLAVCFALFSFSTAAHAQACPASDQSLAATVFDEDFGTGSGRAADSRVLSHNFQASGAIQDDLYAVGISTDFGNQFARTAGDVDADGNTNGRWLFINMRGRNETPPVWQGEFFRVNNIPLALGAAPAGSTLAGFEFTTDLVGTCAGCSDVPEFTLIVENAATGNQIASQTSADAGVSNNDLWTTASITVDDLPINTVTAINLVLFNSQPEGDNGNDVGVDNIIFTPRFCPPPTVDLEKSVELVTNIVSPSTRVDNGDVLRYTYTATNTGVSIAYNTALSEALFNGANGSIGAISVASGGSDLDDGDGTATDIAAGESISFTADYVIQQADITNAVTVTNQGEVAFSNGVSVSYTEDSDNSSAAGNQGSDGTPVGGSTENPTVITLPPAVPEISITKSADDDQFVTVGQIVTYTYTVTNDGNEVIRGLSINDTHNGAGPAPTPQDEDLLTDNGPANDSTDATANDGIWDILAPGDVIVFTGTYTVQQTDIDNLQ
ncbi:MAG: hypothetical protein ABJP48_08560 [Erythrobacter sp.]